ncbi:hypothetical protein ACXU4B_17060 [Dyella soli]|uniref:Uncharacterized protein n=1 Tax=Dyella soli TaxID=522319 RepID=A0A4R0YEJ7_9GAMM|nr:hypothetical protein [Dyella soli]TCI06488.1 hypothetical protein EZM97_33960 [Dyella soli]
MARLSYRQYQQRTLVAMAAYTAFMLLVWPAVRSAPSLPLKVLLALAPLVPMFYVLALLARRIRDSDELEQRTHLIALSVATGITAALSLLGGFLCIAGVVPIDGSVLIWVFPLMMFSYGGTRWYVSRAYGGDAGCADEGGMTRAARALWLGLITAVAALYGWRQGWDSFRVGLLAGMAAAFLLGGVLAAVVRWRTRARVHG